VSWWLLIFGRALCLLICRWRGYPQILVLELAADKPGDIEYFLDFIKPKMGVLTSISQVHLANYSKFSQLIAEKRKLITALPREGYAVLNFDDELIVRTADKTKGRIISYGINNSEVEIRALEVKITQKDEVIGLSFKLSYQGTVTPVFISRFVSLPQVSSLLAAAAVGVIYGLTPLEITQSLEKLKPLPGRFELKEGLNNLLVIDDTYNAAPVSTCGALESLITLPLGKRKIAVLGDMLELGSFTEEGHRTVGKRAAEFKIDLLLTLGEKARIISETAELCGLKKVKHFDNKKELIDFLRSELKPEDVVLVKGSRKMKMDEVVDGILTE
jgi:UDP-N-acetylmuramoyl-tripeptide--D-alanyl-D-alanine ligase